MECGKFEEKSVSYIFHAVVKFATRLAYFGSKRLLTQTGSMLHIHSHLMCVGKPECVT